MLVKQCALAYVRQRALAPIVRPTCRATCCRYEYQKGKAIVFGSHFVHGTEAGRSEESDGRPHVYLSFTFGSDDEARWDVLSQDLDGHQSRVLMLPNGTLALSQLGRELQLLEALRSPAA